jgi:antitoxin ParD1/3/4
MIQLTPELERQIDEKMRSGGYNSASEVVREALRLMEQRDRLLAMCKRETAEKIAVGLESLRAGKGRDGEAVFDRIEAELNALESKPTLL